MKALNLLLRKCISRLRHVINPLMLPLLPYVFLKRLNSLSMCFYSCTALNMMLKNQPSETKDNITFSEIRKVSSKSQCPTLCFVLVLLWTVQDPDGEGSPWRMNSFRRFLLLSHLLHGQGEASKSNYSSVFYAYYCNLEMQRSFKGRRYYELLTLHVQRILDEVLESIMILCSECRDRSAQSLAFVLDVCYSIFFAECRQVLFSQNFKNRVKFWYCCTLSIVDFQGSPFPNAVVILEVMLPLGRCVILISVVQPSGDRRMNMKTYLVNATLN